MRSLVLALCLSLSAAACAVAQPVCPAPKAMRFEVTGQVRRSELAFTEGLEFHDGALYESSGDLFGTSRILRFDPVTGKASLVHDGGHDYFGEGMTIFGGRIYQMTWREHRVFLRDLKGRLLREFRNPRDGWGLTHDASRLIASDGSDRLFFLRPTDFSTLGSVPVREGAQAINQINELEYVDGAVFANVFETSRVLKIDVRSGCVLAAADLRGLYARFDEADRRAVAADSNFVLNGIAHDAKTGLFTVTGKYWPLLFTGRFVEG